MKFSCLSIFRLLDFGVKKHACCMGGHATCALRHFGA